VHRDTQADQPQGQLGREVAQRTPGPTVVDSEAAGQPPATEGQSELLLHGLSRDPGPSSQGGKPRSTGPLRCIRRSGGASSLLRDFVIEYVLLHPSARSHGVRSPGPGRPAAGDPPGLGTDRLARTNVGGFVPREPAVPGPSGATAHGSSQLPKWGARGVAVRRSAPSRRAP
jgi:hypothetical protein